MDGVGNNVVVGLAADNKIIGQVVEAVAGKDGTLVASKMNHLFAAFFGALSLFGGQVRTFPHTALAQ